jgi:hypothetical protein
MDAIYEFGEFARMTAIQIAERVRGLDKMVSYDPLARG